MFNKWANAYIHLIHSSSLLGSPSPQYKKHPSSPIVSRIVLQGTPFQLATGSFLVSSKVHWPVPSPPQSKEAQRHFDEACCCFVLKTNRNITKKGLKTNEGSPHSTV